MGLMASVNSVVNFDKGREFSCLAERVFACEEGLCFTQGDVSF
jgi:hypothetical protein